MNACGPLGDSIESWILIGCWSVFALVWLVGSLYNWRHSGKVERRGGIAWRVVTATWGVLFLVVPRQIWQPLVVCRPWLQWTGVVVLVSATAFTVWARVVLGVMWSSMPVKRAVHELRTNGPYSVTRHPIYTGIIGMLLGTTLINGIGMWGAFLVSAIVLLVIKLRVEEGLMREAFGEAYAAYQLRVPGLLPWPRPAKSG